MGSPILAELTPVAFALGVMPWVMLFFWFVLVKVVQMRIKKAEEADQLFNVAFRQAAGHSEIHIHKRAGGGGMDPSGAASSVGSDTGSQSYAASSQALMLPGRRD